MGHYYFILGILFLTVVAPMWISAHYGTRWRKSRGLSREDEKTMAELWESARRLEAQLAGVMKREVLGDRHVDIRVVAPVDEYSAV